jgi:hypothetical protein
MSKTKPLQLLKEDALTVDCVNSLLSYDAISGHFTWLVDPCTGPRRKGTRAGCLDQTGYWLIKIGQKRYMAHRLAWFSVHGSWPNLDIDHINGDRNDNRLENLREASRSENCANRRLQSSGKSGFKGIHWNKKLNKWQVGLKQGQLKKHIGVFKDLEDAKSAYLRAATETFGAFARQP